MLILVCLVEQIEELNRGQADAWSRECSLEQPFVGSDRWGGPRYGGPQLDHRLAAAGDHHLFPAKRFVDQLGEPVLGIGDAVFRHCYSSLQEMAIDIAIWTPAVHGQHQRAIVRRDVEEPDAMRLLIAM